MEHYLRSAFIVLGLLLLQTTFIPFLSIGGFLPDVFVVWIVYTAIRRGQIEATVAGFIVGLLQDVVTTQFFGLGAMSKTVCGFAAGYFFNENNTEQILGSYRFILITLICSLIHNVLYYGMFLQGSGDSVLSNILEFSIATTIYTCIISVLPMFTFARKYAISFFS
ncbi:MAG: rod shape-determining protein MreD [Ignavibacteriales bacterium]|nr:rod shape-determining protein MreD [Ignavibacteriales bacterium]